MSCVQNCWCDWVLNMHTYSQSGRNVLHQRFIGRNFEMFAMWKGDDWTSELRTWTINSIREGREDIVDTTLPRVSPRLRALLWRTGLPTSWNESHCTVGMTRFATRTAGPDVNSRTWPSQNLGRWTLRCEGSCVGMRLWIFSKISDYTTDMHSRDIGIIGSSETTHGLWPAVVLESFVGAVTRIIPETPYEMIPDFVWNRTPCYSFSAMLGNPIAVIQ